MVDSPVLDPTYDPKTDLMRDVEVAYEEELQGTILRAMVLGPSIDAADLAPSGLLRRAILDRCPEVGINVFVAPEDPVLIIDAKRIIGATYDLCRYEMRLAGQCDLIVILPDSPGSFAELGFFAWHEPSCRKSLILFHLDHQDDDSYIMHGPRKASERNGGTVRFVDYANIDAGWQLVADFAEKKRAVKMDARF